MDKEHWIDFVAGTVGGASGVIVGHPLDTIKVRLQSQANVSTAIPITTKTSSADIHSKISDLSSNTVVNKTIYRKKYTGTFNCLTTIVREEKIRGLYKGMVSPLVGVAVINSLLFGVYGWFLHQLDGDDATPKVSSIFLAGAASGAINSFISCPMELVKIRLQNQTPETACSSTRYNGVIDCCRKIYKTQGLRGFFRGFNATLWRETPSYGVYFAAYEVFSHACTPPGQPLDVPSPGLLLAGGLAGVAGWLSTYPVDVIKTRIQSDVSGGPQGLWSSFKTIYRTEGTRVLFSGLGATAIRAFPTNAATFYMVTYVKSILDNK